MPATSTRNIRATTLWMAPENTPGVGVTPVGTDAVRILTGLDVMTDFNMVDREINLPALGSSPKLSTRRLMQISGLRAELGLGGTGSPAWSALLRAMGFAEAGLTSPSRREFTPVSTNFTSATIWAEGAGVLYKGHDFLGTGTLDFTVGNIPRIEAQFTGLYDGHEAASGPTPDYTAWKTPQAVQPSTVTADVTVGCTYSAGALSGGTAFPSKGLRIDIGNEVGYVDLCSNPFMNIGARAMKATVTFDLTAAQEVAAIDSARDSVIDSMGFKFGMGTNKQFILFMPAVQRMNPKVTTGETGVRLLQFDLDLTQSLGNDEFRLVIL